MPAVSKAQQRFMAMVYKKKKKGGKASPEVEDAAKGMSEKDAKDFASTKHKGLPEKKKVDETTYYRQDAKYQKKLKDDDKLHRERDARMKHGKNFKQFLKDVESAKLRRGEVKKYDKEKGRYVSNKD